MASQGPNSPGTMADDDSSGGFFTWLDVDTAKTSNDEYPSIQYGEMGYDTRTHYLKATNFGFTIPAGATINGIVVEIERKRLNGQYRIINDDEVKIVKSDGSIGAENKADTETDWPLTDTYATYGADNDLWNESWSASDINNANFGVVLSVYSGGGGPHGGAPKVDHIRITVYYTEAPVGTNMKINIGDSWKDVDSMKINIGDTWKDVESVKINVGDEWKTVY